jgi:hypothetical protein
MKKLLKILGVILVSILGILLIIIAYIKLALPNLGPAPQITIEKTAAVLDRGTYLATSVMACMDCHSKREPTQFSMPLIPSTLGEGGEKFDQSMGFPGTFYSANISPIGIGSWTDGEIYRAITTGVRKSGKPIFPVMPYHEYGFAAPEDVKAIIMYLRTLAPNGNNVPPSSADFPMNIILKRQTPWRFRLLKTALQTDIIY